MYIITCILWANGDIKNPFKENRTFIDTKVPLKEADLETIDSKCSATRFLNMNVEMYTQLPLS